ncbi:MAG: cellulase family glycosylhydrolase [Fibrobacter sp.]|nr:cellulase family glycosylhydrolase [Fibrobacter sp.]
MNKILTTFILSLTLVSYANIAPQRVGPVSQYGELLAGKNSAGKGQIYGSCEGITTNKEVQIKGMSLFWSIVPDVGSNFWNASTINKLVSEMNVQLVRAPMGVDEDWSHGNYFTNTSQYQAFMDAVVEAAIKNDIYVIIDYHSHKAHENVENAKTFFRTMAQKWGSYDHVIFEIYNEPLQIPWNTIKTYADQVSAEIRKYSDNLIIVGTPAWDQKPGDAVGNPVNATNISYAFHYYAGSHSINNEGASAVAAMNAGLSVFVSEWGTVNANGDGGVSGSNDGWQAWMNNHKLSWANWSVSNKSEGASIFQSHVNPSGTWSYTESGNYVKNLLNSNPSNYTACADGNQPINSSSSTKPLLSSSSTDNNGSGDFSPGSELIDDFSDNTLVNYWGGQWEVYNDAADNGNSTISSNIEAEALHVNFTIRNNAEHPYAGISTNLNSSGTVQDLTVCGAISYRHKGPEHTFKTNQVTITDHDNYGVKVSETRDWKTSIINLNPHTLSQEGWGDQVDFDKTQINRLVWQFAENHNIAQSFYIDDVRCVDAVSISSSSSAEQQPPTQSSSSSWQQPPTQSSSSAWRQPPMSFVWPNSSNSFENPNFVNHISAPRLMVKVEGKTILLNSATVGSTYTLFNIHGKPLQQSEVLSATTLIPVAQPGYYILRLGSQSTKIIVK